MKKILIISLIVFIGICLFLLFIKKQKKEKIELLPQENFLLKVTSTPKPFQKPTGEKMEINGIEINNLYKNPISENRLHDLIIADNEKYQIVYLQQFKKFLITILDSDFQKARDLAEKDFLTRIGIDESKACQLTVDINTPRSVNAELAGKIFSLSFCQEDRNRLDK